MKKNATFLINYFSFMYFISYFCTQKSADFGTQKVAEAITDCKYTDII